MKTVHELLDIKYPDGLYVTFKVTGQGFVGDCDQRPMIKKLFELQEKHILDSLETLFKNNSDYNKGVQDCINLIKNKGYTVGVDLATGKDETTIKEGGNVYVVKSFTKDVVTPDIPNP